MYLYMIVSFEWLQVHGGWSSWSDWSTCPVTCGIGMQVRHRNCSNPYPLRYGDHCFGDALEHKICDQKPCDGTFQIKMHL
jgi:hypothetical protein